MSGNEHSSVIFVCVFAIVFVVLATAIPSSFFTFNPYSGQVLETVTVPSKWDTSAIGEGNGNITSQDWDNYFFRTNRATLYLTQDTPNDTQIVVDWVYTGGLTDFLRASHRHSWWIFTWLEDMNPWPLTEAYLNSINTLNVSSVTIRCNKGDFQCLLQVSYDDALFPDFTHAWAAGYLQIWVGIREKDTQTQAHYDAWTLVGQILTFQAPDINPYINALIAIPFWVSLVVALLYVLKAILPW